MRDTQRPPAGLDPEDHGHVTHSHSSDLVLHLQKALATRELTQVQAAGLLHVKQPRVGDLRRGRIDLFSTNSLIDMLARLGVRVRVVLNPVRGRVA